MLRRGFNQSIFTSLFKPLTVRPTDPFSLVFNGGNLPERVLSKPALIDAHTGKTRSYRELISDINSFASALKSIGFKSGQVLGIYSPNNLQYPVALFGTIRAGGIATTANPTYQVSELAYQLINSNAKLLISWPDQKDIAFKAAKEANIPDSRIYFFSSNEKIDGLNYVSDFIEHGKRLVASTSFEVFSEQDCQTKTAYMCYSSGTTGRSKGVESTHDNIIINNYQIDSLEKVGEDDVSIAFLPFFHIYAMVLQLHYCLWKKATLVVQSKFHFEEFLHLIERYKATYVFIVPPVALSLAKSPLVDKYDLSSLKACICAAAPLGSDVIDEIKARIGVEIRQAYGMTELSPLVTYTPYGNVQPGSSGILVPSVEAKIIDCEGNELGINSPGELCVKGRNVMKGYLNNKAATDCTIIDGWLHTGDVAFVNRDGHFFIVDRIKELIKYKGFPVAPAELEALLLTHPCVSDAAVIGIPDPEAGELPKAFVVLKNNSKSNENDLISFVQENAGKHKWLRGGVEFIEKVPKSASGKILRRLLR
jgi:acyl-CoA synthetase (AMP-forming)/AMP-acid ligase II